MRSSSGGGQLSTPQTGPGGEEVDLKTPARIGSLGRTDTEEVNTPDHLLATYGGATQPIVFSASRNDDAGAAVSKVDDALDEFHRIFTPDATFSTPTRNGVKYNCVSGKSVDSEDGPPVTQCRWASGKFDYSLVNDSTDLEATLTLAAQAQSAFLAINR